MLQGQNILAPGQYFPAPVQNVLSPNQNVPGPVHNQIPQGQNIQDPGRNILAPAQAQNVIAPGNRYQNYGQPVTPVPNPPALAPLPGCAAAAPVLNATT